MLNSNYRHLQVIYTENSMQTIKVTRTNKLINNVTGQKSMNKIYFFFIKV